jgi:hypothetical protein
MRQDPALEVLAQVSLDKARDWISVRISLPRQPRGTLTVQYSSLPRNARVGGTRL